MAIQNEHVDPHLQNTDTQLDSGVLNIDGSDNITLNQNSVDAFTSFNSGAIVNTLVLKEGKVGIGTASPGAKLEIANTSTDHSIYINQSGVLASGKHGLFIYSNAIQVNERLVRFWQDNAASTKGVVYIDNDGSGTSLYINHNGGTGAGKYGLWLASANAASTTADTALAMFEQLHASTTQPVLELNHQGNGAHIRMTGDPSNSSPNDGDFWYTGTALKFQDGGTTRTLSWT